MNLQLEINGRLRRIELKPVAADGYEATLDGKSLSVGAHLPRPDVLSLIVDGRAYRCMLEDAGGELAVHINGERFVFQVNDPRSLKSRRSHAAGADGPRAIKAPMPGRVLRVLAEVGERVAEHQGIVVIEAMKMQNELKSPKAGKVAEIRVKPGGTVGVGEVLAVIE